MSTTASRRREKQTAQTLRAAAEALGPMTPGMSLLALTQGQWSMLDAVTHLVTQVGSSDIAVWTWAIAAYDVAALVALQARGLLRQARLIVDYDGMRSRSHDGVAQWQAAWGAGAVLSAISHAKMVRIASASGLRLLVRGSMNMNLNARWEQLDLTEGGPEYDLVARMEADLPRVDALPSQGAVSAASKIRDAWEPESLACWGALKPWRI